jgi:hypothetical protein
MALLSQIAPLGIACVLQVPPWVALQHAQRVMPFALMPTSTHVPFKQHCGGVLGVEKLQGGLQVALHVPFMQ